MKEERKTYEVRAEIVAELTQEDIDDILCGALEGGVTACWCKEVEVDGDYLGEYASEQISRGGTLTFHDVESVDKWQLTLEKFLNGFSKWLSEGGDWYGAVSSGKVDTGEIDADRADAIVQYALFGDIVFG